MLLLGRCYAAAWALLCCCLDAAMLIHSTVSMSSADHLACCLFRRGSAPQRWSGTYAASTTARGGPCSATWKARCAGCTRRSCARSASSALWRALSRALSTDHTIERGRFNDYRTFCLTLPNILPTNLGKSTRALSVPTAGPTAGHISSTDSLFVEELNCVWPNVNKTYPSAVRIRPVAIGVAIGVAIAHEALIADGDVPCKRR